MTKILRKTKGRHFDGSTPAILAHFSLTVGYLKTADHVLLIE